MDLFKGVVDGFHGSPGVEEIGASGIGFESGPRGEQHWLDPFG